MKTWYFRYYTEKGEAIEGQIEATGYTDAKKHVEGFPDFIKMGYVGDTQLSLKPDPKGVLRKETEPDEVVEKEPSQKSLFNLKGQPIIEPLETGWSKFFFIVGVFLGATSLIIFFITINGAISGWIAGCAIVAFLKAYVIGLAQKAIHYLSILAKNSEIQNSTP